MPSPPAAPSPPRHALDQTVRRLEAGLEEWNLEPPAALLWLGTGEGQLPDAFARHVEVPLRSLGAPEPWTGSLHGGRIAGLSLWMLEDHSSAPLEAEAAAWVHGLPAWLAARAGATVLLHTTAGTALSDGEGPRAPVGGIGLVRDHLNLSGQTPLLALGGSRLGPLFPDLTALHHLGLRHRAMARAEQHGLRVAEVIAACTPSPALETPAERLQFARAGAEVAVQGLQWPLLAAAHAGLAALSIVAVTDDGEGPADVTALVEAAGIQARHLEDLVLALVPDLAEAAQALGIDG